MRASPAAWPILPVLAVCLLTPRLGHGADTEGLKVLLTSDRAVYARREPVTLILKVVNDSPNPVHLNFRSSQRFDLLMRDGAAREVWRWSAGRMFAQAAGEETLNPSGGELRFQATARGDFPPGVYTVTGLVPALEGTLSAETAITVR